MSRKLETTRRERLTEKDTTICVSIVTNALKNRRCRLCTRSQNRFGKTLDRLTFPSGWTTLRPICRSIVNSGSLQLTSSLSAPLEFERPKHCLALTLETLLCNEPRTPSALYLLQTLWPWSWRIVMRAARSSSRTLVGRVC